MATGFLPGASRGDDCPRMLEPMSAMIEAEPCGLSRRFARTRTKTRAVEVEYAHSSPFADRVIDLGLGSLENPSAQTRRIRYHHEIMLAREPLMLLGPVQFESTKPARFDLRIGCESLQPGAEHHVVDGGGDRVRLRVEAVLEPGERMVFWWSVDLDIVAAGRLPHDRDGDGDLDVDDLGLALRTLERAAGPEEIEAFRSLVFALGTEGCEGTQDAR